MELQRCNDCMSVFDEDLTRCPSCGRDDCLMYPFENTSNNPIDANDSFGLEEIIKWASWVDHTEGTEASSREKAICVAHAILEAAEKFDNN